MKKKEKKPLGMAVFPMSTNVASTFTGGFDSDTNKKKKKALKEEQNRKKQEKKEKMVQVN